MPPSGTGFQIAQAYVSVTAQPNQASVTQTTSQIGSTLTKWAVGLGLGALITKGLVDNLNVQSGVAKLTAQMNLTSDVAAKAGKLSGQVYRDNFGSSMENVNEAIRAVGSNMVNLGNTAPADLRKITEGALGISSVFNVDVNDATRAAGKLMSSGLATSSQQAFDIITRGFQNGLDSSGDFLDTLNEYSPQFSKLGVDGPTALGLLQQGLKAGARDTDAIADSFKEFSIRAIDGSTTTAQGFAAVGLNAKQMADAIGQGGPAAQQALGQTIAALQGMKDPVAQNQAGVALFGTQWEDTVRKILPSLDLTAASTTNIKDATDQMNATMGATPEAKIETIKRQFEGLLMSSTQLPGPLGVVGTTFAAMGAQGITAAAGLTTIASNMSGLIVRAGTAAISFATSAASIVASIATTTASTVAGIATQVASWVVLGVQALLNAAKVAAAWIISLGPIALVIAAVIGLVALIIANFDTIKNAIGAAWEWVKSASSAAWDAIRGAVSAVLGAIGTAISFYFNAWKTVITTVIDTIRSVVTGGFDAVRNAVSSASSSALGAATNAFNSIKNAISSAISSVVSTVRGLPGQITGALGNVGSMLYNSGRSIIQGLINGIKDMAGNVKNAISGVLSDARRLLPFSPAKEGPFSGKGWTTYSGASMIQGIITGLQSKAGDLATAASDVMGQASMPLNAPVAYANSAGNGSLSVPVAGRTLQINQLTLQVNGSLDMTDESSKRRFLSQVRDGLVNLENETK